MNTDPKTGRQLPYQEDRTLEYWAWQGVHIVEYPHYDGQSRYERMLELLRHIWMKGEEHKNELMFKLGVGVGISMVIVVGVVILLINAFLTRS